MIAKPVPITHTPQPKSKEKNDDYYYNYDDDIFKEKIQNKISKQKKNSSAKEEVTIKKSKNEALR